MIGDPKHILDKLYEEAMTKASGKDHITSELPEEVKFYLNIILEHSESSKGVLTVLFTSTIYKYLNPQQDIRKHQQSIEGGYSGRTFDSKYITPFLREKKFPSMAESGWLTRSLEQKSPYTLDYKGAIRPTILKSSFLNILDILEKGESAIKIADFIMQGLIIQRDCHNIFLARPHNLSIDSIIKVLTKHFSAKYSSDGASRLPVLALYAIYKSMMPELKRFDNKILMQLESHTSADIRSGMIGDINIVDSDNNPFEAVEVKFDIPVDHNIIEIAYEKIQPTTVKRYYILSTVPPKQGQLTKIESDIMQIKNTHGCQMVVNGVLPTLKYYLRLIDDPSVFITNYVSLLENDTTIKFEHKSEWNLLISKL